MDQYVRRVVSVRLDNPLLDRIKAWLRERTEAGNYTPLTFTDFIELACLEKLDHTARGRKRRCKVAAQRHPASVISQGEEVVLVDNYTDVAEESI